MRRSCVWFALALVLAVSSSAWAQAVAVAQLSGAVTDESGGVLPGVEVTVTQTATGMTRFVISGTNGEFVFTSLPIGPYKLEAKLSGFSAFEQTGIVLNVGDSRAVNVTMKLGQMTETIRVEADAMLVETRSLSVGQVTSEELIVGLPLNGRSATQLILLQGGAVEPGGGTSGDRAYPGAVAISVAGGTSNSTMYLVDGGYNNDPQQNSGNAIPFPDALQEFRTEAGVRDARFGMSTGATVNAVTKSGTNQYRGNAFEFARNHRFNSKSYFELEENGGEGRSDGLSRNQFGGTIGGPVLRDKLFFFGGTQVTKENIIPLVNDVTVPTQDVLRGDFTRIMSAVCRGRTTNLQLGAPFVDNKVDPALFHPISRKIMSMVPVADPAQDPDGCGRYQIRRPNNSTDQQYIGRVDFQATQNMRIFFREFYSHFEHPALFNAEKPNLLEAQGTGRGDRAFMQTISTGLDYVVTTNLFASTRFSHQYTGTFREHNEGVPTWKSLGVNAWAYTTGKGQDFLAGGLWNTALTGKFYASTPSVSQDFDWTRGAHSLSFGGSWTRPSTDGDGTFAANGNMGFSGIFTSGTTNANGGFNLADFVLGYPNSYNGSGSQINNVWVHTIGMYANDVWRLGRRFTINWGARWEPYLAVKDANGFNMAFSREAFDRGYRSVVYPKAPVGLLFNGDPGFPTNGANTNDKWLQIAPRAGFVWDPAGDGVQTIRVGTGLYFDTPKLWETGRHPLNAPFGNRVSAIAPTSCPGKPSRNGCPIDFDNPWSSTPGGDPQANLALQNEPVILPDSNVSFPLNGNYVSMPVDATPMRVYQWNVSYQRQFMTRFMFDVTYTGNRQEHIWISGYGENVSIYIPGNCAPGQFPGVTAAAPACSNSSTANQDARRALRLLNPTEGQYYGDMAQAYLDAKGRYHGLKLGLQKRLSDGWSANTNYTLSKCINEGEPSVDIGSGSFPVVLQDYVNNPKPDPSTSEGACNADRRHVFNLSTVLISRGLGSGFVNVLTKDWQIGFIYTARSGSPLTPGVTGNLMLTNTPQRAVVVPGVDPNLSSNERVWIEDAAGRPTRLQWFNMAAFANNSPGNWGNATRGMLTGPAFWNADLAFSRNITFAGGRRAELRIEAFNLFNNVNWANPNVTVDNTNAGMVTDTAGDPRIMQFAIKYAF